MWLGEEFWGLQGRVARITAGPWAGRYAYIYPEFVDDWWVMVISPSPSPTAPGDVFIDDGSYLEDRARDWPFEWVPLGPEEEALEKLHFGRRPLSAARRNKRRWKRRQ